LLKLEATRPYNIPLSSPDTESYPNPDPNPYY